MPDESPDKAPAAPAKRPVVVIRRRKAAHGGHHGGAWKVAYADFVTAMMALFIVLWLMGADKEVQEGVQVLLGQNTRRILGDDDSSQMVLARQASHLPHQQAGHLGSALMFADRIAGNRRRNVF